MNREETMNKSIARLALSGCAAALAACVTQPPAPSSTLPASLEVPAGQVLALKAQGNGVQVYECRAAQDDATRFSWTLKAPEAKLLDERGSPIGRHYAGPSWELADGSRVVGELKARANSPDANAIPWLLLDAKANYGSGLLAHVASVQRLHTTGGKAPADGCDAAHAGEERRVPYTADYYFYNAGS